MMSSSSIRSVSLVSKEIPVRGLLVSRRRGGGRAATGCITIWHRGGSNFHCLYRIVDFVSLLEGIPSIVRRLEYDPNSNVFIALVCYVTGVLSYILAYNGIRCGDILAFFGSYSNFINMSSGSKSLIGNFRERLQIYNFGSRTRGCIFARASGVSAMVLSRFSRFYSVIRFPSNEENYVFSSGIASSGRVLSTLLWLNRDSFMKAGRRRWLGSRPVVRGVAMNPVDHPHGGGEGSRKGRLSVSPWGWLTNGSRRRERSSFIISRRDWYN